MSDPDLGGLKTLNPDGYSQHWLKVPDSVLKPVSVIGIHTVSIGTYKSEITYLNLYTEMEGTVAGRVGRLLYSQFAIPEHVAT